MPSDALDNEEGAADEPGAGRADAVEAEEGVCAAAAAGILPADSVPG